MHIICLSTTLLYMQKKKTTTTTNRIRKDQGISKLKSSIPELKQVYFKNPMTKLVCVHPTSSFVLSIYHTFQLGEAILFL